jgi:hypothetical protein
MPWALWAARCWDSGSDVFAAGYGNSSIGGIVLVGLGGGVGLQLARRWRNRQSKQDTGADDSKRG